MRIKKLQNLMRGKKIDVSIFFSLDEKPNTNIIYFSGYSGIGILVIPKDKDAFLVVPDMEYEKGKKTGLKIYNTGKKKKLLETLVNLIFGNKINKIGIEEDKCSVYLYKKLKKALPAKYTDISFLCDDIRILKEEAEIFNIKKACYVTDKTFFKICKNFKFKTEKEIKDFILKEFNENNCSPAFPPIVASSANSSQPHYEGESKIKKGFLLIDFGAKYKGYCADMTRMLYVGKPKQEERENYNLVLKTVIECENASVKKRKFAQLYELSLSVLGKKSEYFTHGLGHGLGLDIHEAPSLTTEGKEKIQDNIPFTIEPGLYFMNKYGIRIEDTVIIKNKKLEVLTKSKKMLVIVDKIN